MHFLQRLLTCVLLAATALATGCAEPAYFCRRDSVYGDVLERSQYGADSVENDVCLCLPNGAALEDGLAEEEAVLIALWNNAFFQETLVDLDLAASDLVQAGLLPNPEIVYFFPASDKPFKYAIDFPLEALWLRPIRIAAAERESQRACQRLAQAGLDLIRDTRQAYADALVAHGQVKVAEEALQLRNRIAKVATARVEAGEASPQESSVAEIDVDIAAQALARMRYDVGIAEERLRNLLGIAGERHPLRLVDALPPVTRQLDADVLAQEAVATRPDMVAAEIAVSAADARVRLAEVSWFRVLGILDATSGRKTGHEFSPAFRATIPIFNWNGGLILRAEAERERAVRQQRTVHDRIMLEVHQAHLRYEQASEELQVLEDRVMPEVETGIRRAEAAFREGDAPYLVVLQASQQLLNSLARREQLHGELRRTWAELERSVGRHIVPPSPVVNRDTTNLEELGTPAMEGTAEE
jgi:cobalt-zinc-cadmium efflux system outer membrane protein